MSAPTILHGDCLDLLRTLPDASVDAVVTDPPYGLSNTDPAHVAETITRWVNGEREFIPKGAGFMGRPWDAFVPPVAVWDECLRVLKPGGHALVFAGSRTVDLMTLGLRLAGFDIRDSVAWLYGSGFSKGGLLGNKPGLSWCECGENPLPYNHANNTDLRGLRSDLHPAPIARREGHDVDMLAPVQREAPGRGVGEARTQGPRGMEPGDRGASSRGDARREEPSLEGRDVHRAGQGLSDGADAGSPASAGERLRGRASAGHGIADRSSRDAARGGASHQPRPSGQPAGEPDSLPGPHEPLDDGALRGRAECPRCGGFDPAFRGFSTTLKPAFEPIVVARKPLAGTVAANVLAHGTGALNIGACRIDAKGRPLIESKAEASVSTFGDGLNGSRHAGTTDSGRWPANVVLDESQAEALDEQSGELTSGLMRAGTRPKGERETYGQDAANGYETQRDTPGDSGGASRFFYVAKADASERVRVNGTAHPTVKPLSLMRWLVRLVTPPGGTVLEPFAGSGTTVEACVLEGFDCIAIEREAEYLPLIEARIARRRDPVKAVELAGEDGGLFDLLGEETA